MTVRIGDVTFFDWISLQYTDGWTDTFIFCIDSKACIPPFNYAPLIRRLVAHVVNKRSCASIWVQVDSPGEWFMLEVRKSLRGLKLPFVVTRKGDTPRFEDFSFRPTLHHDPLRPPPNMDDGLQSYSSDELRCLRALGRMAKGNEHEVEVMTDLPMKVARDLLVKLESEDLVEQTNIHKTKHKKSKPTQPNRIFSRFGGCDPKVCRWRCAVGALRRECSSHPEKKLIFNRSVTIIATFPASGRNG